MKTIIFSVTEKCNIECKFCALGCSPKAVGSLSGSRMKDIIAESLQLFDIKNIVFTGGEPLLYKADVSKAISYAKKNGIKTRIVTNGYWATTPLKAEKLLFELVKEGLSEINISVDDFHQEFIPLGNVKNAVEASLKLNLPIHLAHKTYPESKSNKNTYEKLINKEIKDIKELNNQEIKEAGITFSSGITVPIGRHANKVALDDWKVYQPVNYMSNCDNLLDSVNINADETLSPCCGLFDKKTSMFRYAKLSELSLEEILNKASKNAIYNWLAIKGPYEFRNLLKELNSNLLFSDEYYQNCQICNEIFNSSEAVKTILKHLDKISHYISLEKEVFELKRKYLIKETLQ